jgi:hypothetical protein
MTGTESDKLTPKVRRIIDRQLRKSYQYMGNVREPEQCVRSVLLRRDYKREQSNKEGNLTIV